MKAIVKRWVHLSYSHDLQQLGYAPYEHADGPYDAFLLTHEDWTAFRGLYDPAPTLYEEKPT